MLNQATIYLLALSHLHHALQARIAAHQVERRSQIVHLAPQAPLVLQLRRQILVHVWPVLQALTALVELEPHQLVPLEHIVLLEHPTVLSAELEVFAPPFPNLKHLVQPAHIAPHLAHKQLVLLEPTIIVPVLHHVCHAPLDTHVPLQALLRQQNANLDSHALTQKIQYTLHFLQQSILLSMQQQQRQALLPVHSHSQIIRHALLDTIVQTVQTLLNAPLVLIAPLVHLDPHSVQQIPLAPLLVLPPMFARLVRPTRSASLARLLALLGVLQVHTVLHLIRVRR